MVGKALRKVSRETLKEKEDAFDRAESPIYYYLSEFKSDPLVKIKALLALDMKIKVYLIENDKPHEFVDSEKAGKQRVRRLDIFGSQRYGIL